MVLVGVVVSDVGADLAEDEHQKVGGLVGSGRVEGRQGVDKGDQGWEVNRSQASWLSLGCQLSTCGSRQ